MNDLLLANIRKSLKLLNTGDIRLSLLPDDCTWRPIVRNTPEGIVCPQADYFGFYALRNAFRGVLLGANYLASGQAILVQSLYGPAVTLFYTASFHALHSFLALNGRVVIELTPTKKGHAEDIGDMVIAILNKKNQWIFEPRKRSHVGRWLELESIFAPRKYEIPAYFKDLFDYFFTGRGHYKCKVPLKEYVRRTSKGEKISPGTPYEVRDKLKEFLRMVAETRHIAMYESFGSDPVVVEGLINRDIFSTRGIDRQANQFERFATTFFQDITERLNWLIEQIEIEKDVRSWLFVSVYTQPFDEPEYDILYPENLASDLKSLHDWLEVK